MFIRKVLDPSTNLVRRPTPWPWLGESTVVLDSELPRRRIWHDWRLGNQAGLLPKVCSATLQQAHVYEYVTCGYTPLQWQITPFSTLIFSYIVFSTFRKRSSERSSGASCSSCAWSIWKAIFPKRAASSPWRRDAPVVSTVSHRKTLRVTNYDLKWNM